MHSDSAKIVSLNTLPASISIKASKDILWPCYAYRIVIPQQVSINLNVFELTLLRLHKTGITLAEKLAELTCLESELVEFICKRLEQRGYLKNHELSDYAKEVLDIEPKPVFQSIIMLQDAITNKLLPYAFTKANLPSYKQIERQKNNIMIFYPDAQNLKNRIKAQKISYPADKKSLKPSPKKVLGALKKASLSFDIDINGSITVQEEPEAIYLHCSVFLQEGNSEDFFVSDGLGKWVCDDFAQHLRKKEYSWLTKFQYEAVARIVNKEVSSASLYRYPEVTKRVKKLLDMAGKSQLAINTDTQKDKTREQQSSLLFLFEATEWVLGYLSLGWGVGQVELNLLKSLPYHEIGERLGIKAQRLRFNTNERTKTFLGIDNTRIQKALNDPILSPELRPLLAVMILGADGQSSHPFYQIGRTYPDFLEICLWLHNERNLMHQGTIKLDAQELENFKLYRDKLFKIFVLLLPDLNEELNIKVDAPSLNDDVRLEARLKLEKILGMEFFHDLDVDLKDILINSQLAVLHAVKDKIIGSAYLLLSSAVERVLADVLRKEERTSQESSLTWKKSAISTMKNCGFLLSNDTFKAINSVAEHFIDLEEKNGKGTLGAKIIMLFVRSNEENLNKLKINFASLVQDKKNLAQDKKNLDIDLSDLSPNFLESLFALTSKRGHGSKESNDATEAELSDLRRLNLGSLLFVKNLMEVYL